MTEPGPSGEADLDRRLVDELPRLRGYVRLRCGPLLRRYEEESDLVQSVCREALQARGDYRDLGPAAFRAWLMQQIERKVVDRIRRLQAQKRDVRREVTASPGVEPPDLSQLYATLSTPSGEAMGREFLEKLEERFHELPEKQQRAVLLHHLMGLAIPDVARELGESDHYTRTLISRGFVKLSELLR